MKAEKPLSKQITLIRASGGFRTAMESLRLGKCACVDYLERMCKVYMKKIF